MIRSLFAITVISTGLCLLLIESKMYELGHGGGAFITIMSLLVIWIVTFISLIFIVHKIINKFKEGYINYFLLLLCIPVYYIYFFYDLING